MNSCDAPRPQLVLTKNNNSNVTTYRHEEDFWKILHTIQPQTANKLDLHGGT